MWLWDYVKITSYSLNIFDELHAFTENDRPIWSQSTYFSPTIFYPRKVIFHSRWLVPNEKRFLNGSVFQYSNINLKLILSTVKYLCPLVEVFGGLSLSLLGFLFFCVFLMKLPINCYVSCCHFFSKKLDKFTLLELQCISLCFCIAFLMVFPHQVGKVILQIVTRSWQYACKYYLTSNTQLSVT